MPDTDATPDLEALSKSELEALRRQVERSLSKSEARRKRDALAGVKRAVKALEFTLEEIFAVASETRRKRRTVPDDLIRQRAEEIWEAEGRPEGRQNEHWQQASEEIARERSTSEPKVAPKASRRTARGNSTEVASSDAKATSPVTASAAQTAPDTPEAARATDALPDALPLAKYRHPENPQLTWSGRGRRPAWIRDAIEAGRRMTDFEVGP